MPFAGGAKGFDDSDGDRKPKQARPKSKSSYNTYTRKRKRRHGGKAHGMRASGIDRIKGS